MEIRINSETYWPNNNAVDHMSVVCAILVSFLFFKLNTACCGKLYFYFEVRNRLVSGIRAVVFGRLDASRSVRFCVLTSLRGRVAGAHRTSGLRSNRKLIVIVINSHYNSYLLF